MANCGNNAILKCYYNVLVIASATKLTYTGHLYLHLIKYIEIVCCVEFYKLKMLPQIQKSCT